MVITLKKNLLCREFMWTFSMEILDSGLQLLHLSYLLPWQQGKWECWCKATRTNETHWRRTVSVAPQKLMNTQHVEQIRNRERSVPKRWLEAHREMKSHNAALMSVSLRNYLMTLWHYSILDWREDHLVWTIWKLINTVWVDLFGL